VSAAFDHKNTKQKTQPDKRTHSQKNTHSEKTKVTRSKVVLEFDPARARAALEDAFGGPEFLPAEYGGPSTTPTADAPAMRDFWAFAARLRAGGGGGGAVGVSDEEAATAGPAAVLAAA
jgi:hypothetical protein